MIVEHNIHRYGKEIAAAATKLRVEPAALHAVAAVEVGEVAYPDAGLPIARFEVHAYLRKYPRSQVVQLRDAPTAWHADAHWYRRGPSTDWVRVHSGSQADEWGAIAVTSREDPVALECASYGVGQLMGWHWKLLGYPSCRRMVAAAINGGVPAQVEQWARYIERDKSGEMLLSLQVQDWEAFVHLYNGSGQVAYYTGALTKRYEEALKVLSAPLPAPEAISLDTWRERQAALAKLGYDPGPVDGQPGTKTTAAVKAFQAANGLSADGVWGRYTEEHVRRALGS